MRHRILRLSLLSTLVVGCATAPDPHPVAPSTVQPAAVLPPMMTVDRLATSDVRGANEAMWYVRQEIEAIPPAERAQARDALAALSVTCPYTRASLQLAFVVMREVDTLEKAHLDGMVHADLDLLKHGISDHIAVLDRLDVQLEDPAPHDALYGVAGVQTRADLLAADAPVEQTAVLVQQIPDLVDGLNGFQLDHIQWHSERYTKATMDQTWTFSQHLDGWRHALTRMEPFITDAPTRTRMQALIAVLDAHAGMGC